MIIVRYADDFVVGFQDREEAESFLHDLRVRLREYNLELHPEKTRLIEFGRAAREKRRRRGEGRPETFDFLGFTHICGVTNEGYYKLIRQTQRARMARSLKRVNDALKRRRHSPIQILGAWLRAVLNGHYQYYAVPGNLQAIRSYHNAVLRSWHRTLRSRSQRDRKTWRQMW